MSNNYIYSKIAAAGMFPDRAIKRIEVFHNAVNIHFLHYRSQLVSKSEFLRYFAESRRERGQRLRATSITPEVWQVESGSPRIHPNGYLVQFEMVNGDPAFKCDCHDFNTQTEVGIKTPCCKHVYSVLDALGYNSYRAWIGKTAEEIREDDRVIDYEELCAAELVELCTT